MLGKLKEYNINLTDIQLVVEQHDMNIVAQICSSGRRPEIQPKLIIDQITAVRIRIITSISIYTKSPFTHDAAVVELARERWHVNPGMSR